jgi:(1->4)-alpha-D-glucan 1-alpha-D-glucosylmutase
MASELNVLGRDAGRIARSNWRSCDFTNNTLHMALKEIIARFPVYRTYIDGSAPSEDDRRDIDWAITQARRTERVPDATVFDFLHALLTADLVGEPQSGYSRQAVVQFAMKVQQYSGPVMAKGLEDTAFYRYNRLFSLNEVGGHPDHFGTAVSAFHRANAERAARWPHAMLATATHDTKRGEDTRARLHVLSEMPEEWERHVQTWSRIVRARRGDVEGTAPPDRNDEYLLYQLLLGAWPADLTDVDDPDPAAVAAFAARVEVAMIKSVREAKLHSTWASPDEAYEETVASFLRDCLDTSRSNPFLESFRPFQARVARLGLLNSLGQTLAKLTAPGMPDLYQGSELWDLSLVDPDNRRPVDYGARLRLADDLDASLGNDPGAIAGLLGRWRDGAAKFAVTRLTLALRRAKPALFADGDYEALGAAGEREDHVCAFARHFDDDYAVTAFPRLVAALDSRPGWGDTVIALPANAETRRWQNWLTGAVIEAVAEDDQMVLRADQVFDAFPVALLVPANE